MSINRNEIAKSSDNNYDLNYAINLGIINIADLQEKIEMSKREEFLKKHPYDIWFGKDEYWHTYLPKADGGRRHIKKKKEVDIKNSIIEYWKSQYMNTFKNRYSIWIDRQTACGRTDNTISKYESDYIRFFKGDIIENMDVRDITDETISLFIKRLLTRKDIPYRALKSMYGYMNGVFEKAIIDRVISDNPCKHVDLPIFKQYCKETQKKTSEQRTLSTEEREALLTKIKDSDCITKYAIELSLYTGMRVGELSGLKWEDISYRTKKITVCRSEKYNRKKKEYYISTTKNDKVRDIPLTNNMIVVLKKIKAESIRQGVLGEYVFCNERGRIHARTISESARNNTMSKEFVNTKSIHAIRRTFNSNLKRIGVPTPVCAAILGHTEKVNEENYTYDISTLEDKRKYVEMAGKIG